MSSGLLSYAGSYEEPHFLESCTLCSKPLDNSDIYMYRGNTPFCSQECRQEQIECDEAKERRWKIASSKKTKSTESTTKKSTTVQTGTLVASN